MKKIVLFFAFLFSISFQINAQWFWQNPLPQGNDLHSISIPSENFIYAVTANNILIKSTDYGENWELNIIDSINSPGFYNIQFINPETGFLLSNKFYRTTNGAQNWEEINLGHASNKNFYFLDQVNGWVTGDNGFFKTTDGGETWDMLSSSASISKFDFINTQQGYGINSGDIEKTNNSGYSWEKKFIGANYLYDIEILSDSIVIAIGTNGKIIRTGNSGETWDTIFCPTDENLIDIESISQTTAWIVANGGVILKTTNSGVTWFPQTAYTSTGLYSIKFDANENGYIVGHSGKIFKTTDLGNNWLSISDGYYGKLNEVHFISQNHGWAGGVNGKVLKTTDGGNNWTLISSLSDFNIEKIYFNNEDVGWLSASGRLYKTTDGGQGWIENYIGTNTFSFIDSITGWLISGYKLYKTTDGGDNWMVINDDFIDYGKIYFTSYNTGWAIKSGAFNRIKTTTDGGITWGSEISLSILPSDYVFINENKGWIVGYDGKIINTIDGGITWYNQNSGVNNTLSKVNFTDEMNGYILPFLNQAEKTFILKTNDGGLTWDKQYLEFCSHINLYGSSFIENNIGWLVGDYGTILHTTNGGVTFIEDEENNFTQPKEFLLQQNYPNPFNPSTKISWQSPIGSWQTLKVYDILGNEVATLVNEYRNAGNYEVEFNVGRDSSPALASGIYFYKIQVGDPSTGSGQRFVETKKMILLK